MKNRLYRAWLYSTPATNRAFGKGRKKRNKHRKNKPNAPYSERIQKFVRLKESIQYAERNTAEYWDWRRAVLKRDLWTCTNCGNHGEKIKLEAHHIKDWFNNPKLRFRLDNGKTLCIDCHTARHPWRAGIEGIAAQQVKPIVIVRKSQHGGR